jgi:hypothetical protein
MSIPVVDKVMSERRRQLSKTVTLINTTQDPFICPGLNIELHKPVWVDTNYPDLIRALFEQVLGARVLQTLTNGDIILQITDANPNDDDRNVDSINAI